MDCLDGKDEIHKQHASVIKIHSITSTSKENIKRLHRISNQRQRLSPDFCLSGKFPTSTIDTVRKQPKSSRLDRFFKKQLKTHQITIKKNPRINLIQNTQKIISNNYSKIQKYVLHSTKKLQILSESYHEKQQEKKNKQQRDSYFISIMSDRGETPMKENYSGSQKNKKRKSPESRRLCKGTTTRKHQPNLTCRFTASADLNKHNTNNLSDLFLNQQQLPNQTKRTLYDSLIYTRKLKAQSVVDREKVMQSSLGMDEKLDRERFLESQYEKRVRNRELYQQQRERECKEGFPRKKVDNNSPEVLKIHLKRAGQGLRGALLTQKLDRKEYYQPRSLQIASGARRPNTTVNNRRRQDSEIEPW